VRVAASALFVICLAAILQADVVQVSPVAPGKSFEQLFEQYRRGDANAAAAALSQWSDERIALEARLPDDVTDSGSLAALALFLTEAGLSRRTFGEFVKDTPPIVQPFLGVLIWLGHWGLEDIFEPRAFRAHQLIEELLRRAKADDDARLLGFCRDWYIVAVSYCQRWRLPCVRGLLQKGEHYFGDEDAEFLLLVGSIRQPPIMTRWRMREIKFDATRGQESMFKFRRALRLRSDLVEARVRLGHIQSAIHGFPEGRQELEQALREARADNHQFAAYLAALFLGDLHESAGRMPEAIAHYRMAVEIVRGHTASVALTQALARSGQTDRAWEVGRQMFGNEGPSVDPVVDPFVIYHAAQYWQTVSRVGAMRSVVRLQ
jgi:tetratricopeptide (TPR) repeat protein